MRLFIAEKPSLARAIADVLPGPHKRAQAHIECGDGNTVAWCAGHILQTAPPEAYSPEYKQWKLEHLPILPSEWKLEPSTPDLVKSLKALLKHAKRVVHAGDPDREGQLLVDEVLHFLGYKGPVDRILISDVNPDAVRKALGALEPNTKYRGLSDSALARQRADWLYGMNLTRLYTLLGRGSGYQGVLSVGRVQTPLLGLIVQRDLAIENFRPVPYYVLTATVQVESGAGFRAHWVPGPALEHELDADKRLLRRELADEVRARTTGQRGTVAKASEDKKSDGPPLPYSLADLQIDAARRAGLSAQQVLDACQSLYEKHKLTTYPRSDCSYLPEGHLPQAPSVLSAIGKHAPALAGFIAKADLSLRSKAWNDKKVTAHHAIIPTPNASGAAHLSDTERAVYELICRRYLMQFYPPHDYLQSKLELTIAGETFVATGRQVLAPGWKVVTTEVPEDLAGDDPKPDTESNASLPRLKVGDAITATDVTVGDKKTQPPKPFTDASLMQAMCNVASFVTNPSIKKILRETDGIGTPATRASIIEILLERGFVARGKKTILSTGTGRALIKALPEVATTPDMTAVWEAAMRAISEGEQPLGAFLDRVSVQLRQLIEHGRALGRISVPASTPRQTDGTHYNGSSRAGDGKKRTGTGNRRTTR